jgi:predicted deacylase
MAETIKIGNISIGPGEAKRGSIEVAKDIRGHARDIPILVYRGVEEGPRLWLNGATHGDEPEGSFSIYLALQQLDPKQLRGTVVAVPAMNVEAFAAGKRGDPLDSFSYDMNRIYPGKADGYPTDRVAYAHWLAMKDSCDLQINIHSGGEHSFLSHMTFAHNNAASHELAAALGPKWKLVFIAPQGGNNPSSMMGNLGKGGITVELGGNCRTLTGDFHRVAHELADAYLNVMRHYRMIDGPPAYADTWSMGHQIALLAPATGMFVGAADLPFETILPKDTVLGEIYDLYGDVVASVNAPQEGLVFGLRSRPAVLEGEWCCFFGVVERTLNDLMDRQA